MSDHPDVPAITGINGRTHDPNKARRRDEAGYERSLGDRLRQNGASLPHAGRIVPNPYPGRQAASRRLRKALTVNVRTMAIFRVAQKFWSYEPPLHTK